MQLGVHRHSGQARIPCRIPDLHILGTVAHRQGHAIAWHQSQRIAKTRRHRRDPPHEIAIIDPFAFADGNRGTVGKRARRTREEGGDVHRCRDERDGRDDVTGKRQCWVLRAACCEKSIFFANLAPRVTAVWMPSTRFCSFPSTQHAVLLLLVTAVTPSRSSRLLSTRTPRPHPEPVRVALVPDVVAVRKIVLRRLVLAAHQPQRLVVYIERRVIAALVAQ